MLAHAGVAGAVTGMYSAWTIPPLWTGQTVAIVGTGPSATPGALAKIRNLPTIAVNRAVALVPDADMMVSIDGNWPEEGERFEGLRVVGVPGVPGYYIGVSYERVRLADTGAVVEIRNNVLTAMRVAAKAGAARLLLLGVEPERYEAIHNFRGFAEGLSALVQELRAAGVEVVSGSAEARPPLVLEGMQPLGDSILQRPVVAALARRADVWLKTPWPQIYRGLDVRMLPSGTTLRTGRRNEWGSRALYASEDAPAHAPVERLGYTPHDVIAHGSLVAGMAANARAWDLQPEDLRIPAPSGDLLKALALPEDRPILVYKPLTGRHEWGGLMARDPDPDAFRALLEPLLGRFFAVSLADLEDGKEWLVGEPIAADLALHHAELDFDGLMALFTRAALVFSASGFAVPLAHALGTPAITVFGGFEDARTCSWGARGPWLPILPVKPCPCWAHGHGCDKRVDVAAAHAQIEAFVAAL